MPLTASRPKYCRLTKPDIAQIGATFAAPLLKAAEEKRNAARIESGCAIYEAAFPAEVRKAIKTLSGHCLTKGVHALRVKAENGYSAYVQLGATYQMVQHYSCSPSVDLTLIRAAEEIERIFDAASADIEKMTLAVKSAAIAFKTRHDFGEAWAPLRKLMGADWVDALVQSPESLPVVVNLEGATAALATLRAA